MSYPSGRLRAKPRSKKGVRYVTVYRHYWTGKLMRASDYGYKAWPFGRWPLEVTETVGPFRGARPFGPRRLSRN